MAQVDEGNGHLVMVDVVDAVGPEAEGVAATLGLSRRCSVAEWVSS